MSEPNPRTADTGKKSVCVYVRLTRKEAAAVERQAAAHKPPTVSAWIRAAIVGQLAEGPDKR